MNAALPMPCTECGMICSLTEFHPFGACLMFKACHDGDKVRENLEFILSYRAARAQTPGEIVGYESRMFYGENTAFPGWGKWERVEPRNVYMETIHDRAREIQHYIDTGYRYELRALYAGSPPASLTPGEPAGWQPIETAPQTGRTLLLGYFNALGKWRTLRGQWFSDAVIQEEWTNSVVHEAGWFVTPVECDEEDNGCWSTSPTHWMPLPSPPEAA